MHVVMTMGVCMNASHDYVGNDISAVACSYVWHVNETDVLQEGPLNSNNNNNINLSFTCRGQARSLNQRHG
jgi:hypothetical protein